jgi:hypothetical protein
MKMIAMSNDEHELNIEEACMLAACEAARVLGTTVEHTGVFAWYDRRSGRSYPEVGFSVGLSLNWEQLAESRGADVRVEMDSGLIVFCGSTRKH